MAKRVTIRRGDRNIGEEVSFDLPESGSITIVVEVTDIKDTIQRGMKPASREKRKPMPSLEAESVASAVITSLAEMLPERVQLQKSDDAKWGQHMDPRDAAAILHTQGFTPEHMADVILTGLGTPNLQENKDFFVQFRQLVIETCSSYWPQENSPNN